MSLIDVLEKITVDINPTSNLQSNRIPEKINVPINYDLINSWIKTDITKEEKANVRIELLGAKEELLNENEKEVVLPKGMNRIREINNIQGLTITKSGIYTFRVKLKNKNEQKYKTVANIPIEIDLRISQAQNNQ